MSTARTARPESSSLPEVPLTIEGYSVLHQMLRIRWAAWRNVEERQRREIIDEASAVLSRMEQNQNGQSAVFSLLGHKGDLMLVHFRESFDALNQAELQLARTRLNDYLEPASSYLSVIELGLYESTVKTYRTLAERGIEPHSAEWKQAIEEQAPSMEKNLPPRAQILRARRR